VLGSPHALSIDELVAALEQHTGLDLTSYVAAWVKHAGAPVWPRFDVTFTAGTGTSTLVVHEVAPAMPHQGCKFHVALKGANATDVQLVAIDTTGSAPEQMSVPTPSFAVTAIEFDPQAECLAYLAQATPRDATPARPWVAPPFGAP
jgi:hypothetical protein